MSLLSWLDRDGSTRLYGLLRIGLVMLLWASWGLPFVLHLDLHPLRVGLAVVFYLGSLLWAVGLGTPVVGPLVAAALVVAVVMLGDGDPASPWLQQHRQLTALLAVLFALAPSGRSLSLDRHLDLRHGRTAAERGPLWTLHLVRLAATVIFLTSAAGQLSGDWLSGAAFVEAPGPGRVLAWALLLANIVGAVGPWFRRTRTASILLAGGVYLAVYPLLRVDTVGLCACWLLLAFLPPAGVHRAADRLHGH